MLFSMGTIFFLFVFHQIRVCSEVNKKTFCEDILGIPK